MSRRITIRRPDDWHVHLRDGDMLRLVAPATALDFGRAIIMPNLAPPVVTRQDALAYRDRILAALPADGAFRPLMTLYLTETTDPDDLAAAAEAGEIAAAKLYPAGATTNSDSGVRDVAAIAPVLERMERIGLPLLIHGEVTDPDVDVFDREAVFIETVLAPLADRHPGLKIVLEHVTTEEAVAFVREARAGIAATVTAHHLMIERTDIFRGGIRPHLYCLPIAKRKHHRAVLRQAATSGDPRFFLGTDSAPHAVAAKENACGCAGLYTAPVALACYAQVFAEENALDQLEAFASLNGPAFYGVAPNEDRVTLVEEASDAAPAPPHPDRAPLIFNPDAGLRWRVDRKH